MSEDEIKSSANEQFVESDDRQQQEVIMDGKNSLLDGNVFLEFNQHDERAKKNPFYDSSEELSKNYMPDSKALSSSDQSSELYAPSSHHVPTTPASFSPVKKDQKLEVWNQLARDIVAAVNNFSVNSSLFASSLSSTTTSASAAVFVEEEEEYTHHQRTLYKHEVDARLSSHIFPAIDNVLTFSVMQSMNLRFAQLVVLGMENHGKSTLLERLLKLALFPKGKTRCTTAILRAQLRRGPATLAKISIRNRETLEESNEETELPLAGLEDAVRRLMDKIANEIELSLIATKHEVLIRITREDLPNLDLVDIPGIVSVNDGKNRQDLAQATYKLAEGVVQNEKDYSIFLLIVDAQTEINLSQAAELVRVEKVELQTIGVFTKVDMVITADEDEVLSEILTAKLRDQNLLQANDGWFLCANREPPAGILTEIAAEAVGMTLTDYRFALMAAYEALTFHRDGELCSGMPGMIRKNQTGIPAIRHRAQLLFDDFLVGEWVPHCLTILNSRLNSLFASNAALGVPIPELLPKVEDDGSDREQHNNDNRVYAELLSLVTERAPKLVYENYHRESFQPWPIIQIQHLVMNKVKDLISMYLADFDLCNACNNNNNNNNDDDGSDHNMAAAEAVWTCISKYTDVIEHTEQQWEEKYRFKHFLGRKRRAMILSDTDKHTAIANYAADCKGSSCKEVLFMPALTLAKDQLLSLIDHLCDFWNPQHLVDFICANIDKQDISSGGVYSLSSSSSSSSSGLFFNILQRFPSFRDELGQQLILVWKEAKSDLKSALYAILTSQFESSAATILQQIHLQLAPSPLASENKKKLHMILLVWTEKSKAMAHEMVTNYLDFMREMLDEAKETILIPESCFVKEDLGDARINILREVVDCIHVMQNLSGGFESKEPLVFQQLQQSRRSSFRSLPTTISSSSTKCFASDQYISLTGHIDDVNTVHIMPDGCTIISGSIDKTIKLWDSKDGHCLMTISCLSSIESSCPTDVWSLLTLDNQTILAGLGDDKVGTILKLRIEIPSSESVIISKWTGHLGAIKALIQYRGHLVVSCSQDSTIKLWDSNTDSCLITLTGHTQSVNCLALISNSPSFSSPAAQHHQRVISGSHDNTLIMWDLDEKRDEKREIQTFKGHTKGVICVACLSHERIVSGGGNYDRSIRLWDVISGHCLLVITGHTKGVLSLVVLSDDFIASGSGDNSIITWQVSTGEKRQILNGHSNSVRKLSVLQDGRIVSASSDKTLRIWAGLQ